MMVATCKSVVFSLVGGKCRKWRARLRQIQPKVPLRKQRPGRLFLLSDVKFPPKGERRIGRAKIGSIVE